MNWVKLGSCAVVTSLMWCVATASAEEGAYVGIDLGVTEPTNDNYRSHVETGGTGAPFVGYMFNDYLGMEFEGHFIAQSPDDNAFRRQPLPGPGGLVTEIPDGQVFRYTNDRYSLNQRTKWTTIAGATLGPRLAIPLGDVVELYAIGQGGAFKGMGGRLNGWGPGFSVGGGLDFNVTRNFAIGLFGRWNRAYMAPHPQYLAGHVRNDQGPKDARWASAGLRLTFRFGEDDAPPPPPPPPPAPPAVVQAPPPPPPAMKRHYVLRNVNFDFNKASVGAGARTVLDEVVNNLKNNREWNVAIVSGHTDSVGSDSYNRKLSLRRANAVRDYLVNAGIDSGRIRVEGHGESKPVATNETAAGRAENRRVEIDIE